MEDEEFEKEVEDLVEMIKCFRLIKDKGRKRWLRAAIRLQITKLLKD